MCDPPHPQLRQVSLAKERSRCEEVERALQSQLAEQRQRCLLLEAQLEEERRRNRQQVKPACARAGTVPVPLNSYFLG